MNLKPFGLLIMVKFIISRKSELSWKKKDIDYSFIKGVGEGNRHGSALTLIGVLLAALPSRHWSGFAWPLVRMWNERCTPPEDEFEVLKTFNSIAATEMKKRRAFLDARNRENEAAKFL